MGAVRVNVGGWNMDQVMGCCKNHKKINDISGCRSNRYGRAGGFTLIELLVVISIITLMVSILLPALSKARELGKQMVEMCAARQTMTAMHVYSHDYNGQIIPGYFDTASYYSGYEVVIPDGTTLTGEPLKRWPWRLSYYLEHQLAGSLMVNEMEAWSKGSPETSTGWGYGASLYPSLGMNVYFVGGYETFWSLKKHLVRFDDAAAPSELIVLTSARYNVPASHDYYYGFYRVYPEHGPGNAGWEPAYADVQLSDDFGHVHPRYNGHAVTARVDGHVELDSLDDLRDMRLWSDQAYLADDPDYLW